MGDSKRSDEANEDLLAYITEPRLRPYLQTCDGDLSLALDLYAWNTRMRPPAYRCYLRQRFF